MGLKNEFEIAVVNEQLVFESLMFYCTNLSYASIEDPDHTSQTSDLDQSVQTNLQNTEMAHHGLPQVNLRLLHF